MSELDQWDEAARRVNAAMDELSEPTARAIVSGGVRYGVDDGITIVIHGGHRAERRVKALLGFNPNMHSGMCGKGKCNASVTRAEFDRLKAAGIKVTIDRRFKA